MINWAKELIRVKNLPEKEKAEYKVLSYLKKQLAHEKKTYIGHKHKDWSDADWTVSELLEFLQKDYVTSCVLGEFRGKYDYDTLNEILKNNFKSEYEQSLKKFQNERR